MIDIYRDAQRVLADAQKKVRPPTPDGTDDQPTEV
jgi:hypothetical protein